CKSYKEIDDSDQDPNYCPSDGNGQSSDSEESSPECTVEELLEREDEFLVIENYIEVHHNIAADEKNSKQEIVAYYDKTEAGVDLPDMKCAVYTSSSRTRRWPLAIFFSFDFVQDLDMQFQICPVTSRKYLQTFSENFKKTM
ncbi:hypothetical protein J6590_096602, partial [Homalodisca vitripennis]